MERDDVGHFDRRNRAGLCAEPALLYQEFWQSSGKGFLQKLEEWVFRR